MEKYNLEKHWNHQFLKVLQEARELRIQKKRKISPGRPRTIGEDFLQQLAC